MLVGPSKQLKHVFQIKTTLLRIPTGRRQTNWLFTTVAENLKAEVPVQHADHSATLPSGQPMIQSFDYIIVIWENRHEKDEDS